MQICDLQSLPSIAPDKTEVCDKYGNRWRYNLSLDRWISIGSIVSPATVTATTDGIVSPLIYNQLQALKNSDNPQTPYLKLLPGTDAYAYYFRSSSGLIKFRPETEDSIRIEIDKSKIYRSLLKEMCRGKRGERGEKGKRGQSGLPGPKELNYLPESKKDELKFAIFTPVPLSAITHNLPNNHTPDISVRFYKIITENKIAASSIETIKTYDQLQHLVFHYHGFREIVSKIQSIRDQYTSRNLGISRSTVFDHLSLSKVLNLPSNSQIETFETVTVLIDPDGIVKPRILFDPIVIGVDVNKSIASIGFSDGVASGSIFLENGREWGDGWCVRSRQMGIDGLSGSGGSSSIVVSNSVLDTQNIVATCPIVNVRFDSDRSSLYTFCADSTGLCVQSVRIVPGSGVLSDKIGVDAVFASAQITLDDCKFINRFNVELDDDEFNELDLSYWDPQPGCVTNKNYPIQNFNWISGTTSATCDLDSIWYDAGLKPRSGKYPNAIIAAKLPPIANNKDTFFFAKNIQDGGCPDITSATRRIHSTSAKLVR